VKKYFLAFLLLVTTYGYAQTQDACLNALSLKGLNKFSGKSFTIVTSANEVSCVGDCICKCKYTAPEGSAGLRISKDAGRKEYKLLLSMAANAKAVSADDWLYAFYDISNPGTGTAQMSLTVYYNGKTYNAYVNVYRTEEETKGFLIEVVQRAIAAK
jgi:hypothetical protein